MVTQFWFASHPHAWRLVFIGIGGFRHTQQTMWKRGPQKPVRLSFASHLVWILFQATPAINVRPPHLKSALLRSLQFSFMFVPWSSCGHRSVQMICVFLAYNQNTISVIMLFWQSPGPLDLLRHSCFWTWKLLICLCKLLIYILECNHSAILQLGRAF